MKPSVKLLVVAVLSSILVSSCTLFPPPNEAISPPKRNKNISASNRDITSIVNGFLPEGSILLDPIDNGIKAIHEFDLDKDGEKEILVSYRCSIKNIKSGLMILKIKDDTWQKAFEDTNEFTIYEQIKILDNGYPKLILVNTTEAKNFRDFYSIEWNGKAFYRGIQFTNVTSVDFEDINGTFGADGNEEIILATLKEDSLNHIVLKQFYSTLISASEDEFPEYTKKELEFYKAKAESHPGNFEYSIRLQEIQVKLGMYNEAMDVINRLSKLKLSGVDCSELYYQKGFLLYKKGSFKEARDNFKKSIEFEGNDDRTYKEKCRPWIIQCYIGEGNFSKARELAATSSDSSYPEEVQEVDELMAEDKIYRYINKNQNKTILSNGGLDEFKSWGDSEGIEILPYVPEGGKNKVLLVRYYIFPERASGKTNLGGLGVYWLDGGRLYHQAFASRSYGELGLDINSVKYYIDNNKIPTIDLNLKYVKSMINFDSLSAPLPPQNLKELHLYLRFNKGKWLMIN